LEAGIVLLLLFAGWLLFWSSRLRGSSGLPAGEVLYADTGAWGRPERPLFSARLQLTGKPDYLVRTGAEIVPVEVKSGRAPAGGAHPGHVLQLAAYCALVAEAYGQRPTYGLIKYVDQLWRVPFTPALEQELWAVLADMRADAEADEVDRSHTTPARCVACGLRDACAERLA
jgi:CRISPR-associated exonuclease Cas4